MCTVLSNIYSNNSILNIGTQNVMIKPQRQNKDDK